MRRLWAPRRRRAINFAQAAPFDDTAEVTALPPNAIGRSPAAAQDREKLGRGKRRALSAALAFHLLAVVAAPLAVPPSSELFYGLFRGVRWYVEPLFLNHGYRFFAPEPGPSYLVRYEAETAGGETVAGRFPDLQTQWPRVLYHRHFMLSSRLQGGPNDPLVKAYSRSFAEHLLRRHEARRVRLWVVRHNLPSLLQAQAGMPLDDPRLYEEFPLIEYPEAP